MKKNKNVSNRGAPKKEDNDKVGYDGLKPVQRKQLREIASDRNTSIAAIKREAIEWYLEAVEMGKRTPINVATNHIETIKEG